MDLRIEQPPAFPVSTMVKLVIGSVLIVVDGGMAILVASSRQRRR
jgi:hypothetical protein